MRTPALIIWSLVASALVPVRGDAQEQTSVSLALYAGLAPSAGLKNWPSGYPPRLGHGKSAEVDLILGRVGRFGFLAGASLTERTTSPKMPLAGKTVASKDLHVGGSSQALRAGVILYPPYTRGIEMFVAPTLLRLDLEDTGIDPNPRVDEALWHRALSAGGNVLMPLTQRFAFTASVEGMHVWWNAQEISARCSAVYYPFGCGKPDGTQILTVRAGVQMRVRGAFPWMRSDARKPVPPGVALDDTDRTTLRAALKAIAAAQMGFKERTGGYAKDLATLSDSSEILNNRAIKLKLIANPPGWGAEARLRDKSIESCVVWGGNPKDPKRVRTALERSTPAQAGIIACDGDPLRN